MTRPPANRRSSSTTAIDWPSSAPDLLPGSLGGLVDRSGTRGGVIGYVDYDHPVFEVFRQPRLILTLIGAMIQSGQFEHT